MYSANAPLRLTPMPTVFGHRCWRPARQLRQWPQTMWPSARHALADLVAGDAGAEVDDAADELVADHQARLDRALAPLVPQVDVQVGAADRGLFQLDQHFVRARASAPAPVPSRCPCRLRASPAPSSSSCVVPGARAERGPELYGAGRGPRCGRLYSAARMRNPPADRSPMRQPLARLPAALRSHRPGRRRHVDALAAARHRRAAASAAGFKGDPGATGRPDPRADERGGEGGRRHRRLRVEGRPGADQPPRRLRRHPVQQPSPSAT